MAIVPPSEESTVGVIGRGFISILVGKLAALAGYQTWLVCPPGEEERFLSLLGEEKPSNLDIISGTDTDAIDSNMRETDALMVAVDNDTPMDEKVMGYLLSPNVASSKLKRVVCMSRNLNGKDMGFFVKASKKTANGEVWDGSTSSQYQNFENVVKDKVAALDGDVEYTFVRAGTLKGGGCGSEEHPSPQYLAETYYEMVKKDIISWQFLFDCQTRGVTLAKGDVLPGPGAKAVFTATGSEEAPGDTGRCNLAEAMVRSLAFEECGNVDFGVGTKEARTIPSDEEWKELLQAMA